MVKKIKSLTNKASMRNKRNAGWYKTFMKRILVLTRTMGKTKFHPWR